MESDELRFKHVGLSTDGAVVFCEMDNDQTYAMPLCALERAEDWNAQAKPRTVKIIHDGYAAVVQFDNHVKIDFPSDFVRHICDPSYTWHKSKARATSGVGTRMRQMRELRGLTLDALASRCGIAKPNLSRLENDKVTPTFATINAIARALRIHPTLVIADKKPDEAWTWTLHQFVVWKRNLLWTESPLSESCINVGPAELVKAFLGIAPEHSYARQKLVKYADPGGTGIGGYMLDADKWANVVAPPAARRG